MEAPIVLEWIVDTRYLFTEATETRHLETIAAPYLSLLSTPERASALKYVFPRDAKLSLASSLLKRYAICQTLLPLPWSAADATRDSQGKPIFRDGNGKQPLSFNVSHQDGLAVLFGLSGCGEGLQAEVGVDVVSCSERSKRDEEAIRTNGWTQFVDVYDSVFSPGELDYLKGLTGRGVGVGGRLRYFYALWCLKEAYIKMTGEALLADWLQALEFRNFRPPPPGEESDGGKSMSFGGAVTEVEIFRDGKRDVGVRMELRALGKGYMIGTAVRAAGTESDVYGLKIGEYRMVGLEEIRAFAETRSL